MLPPLSLFLLLPFIGVGEREYVSERDLERRREERTCDPDLDLDLERVRRR